MSLCRQPSLIPVGGMSLVIVSDDEEVFLTMKDNPSSSRGIFGILCDGVIDPSLCSRAWVYQNAMVYSG